MYPQIVRMSMATGTMGSESVHSLQLMPPSQHAVSPGSSSMVTRGCEPSHSHDTEHIHMYPRNHHGTGRRWGISMSRCSGAELSKPLKTPSIDISTPFPAWTWVLPVKLDSSL